MESKVNFAIARLERHDLARAQQYREWARNFEKEARHLHGTTLDPINDYGYIVLPNGCQVKQVIVQRAVVLPQQGRYLIDDDLWSKLDSDQRAGLILHEVIFRDGLRRGHPDSSRSRFLTALMSSQDLDFYTPEQYQEAIHLSFHDAYVWGPGNNRYLVFYDRMHLTLAEAKTFCRSQSAGSDIPSSATIEYWWTAGRGLANSAIGRRAQEIADPDGKTVFAMGYPPLSTEKDPGMTLTTPLEHRPIGDPKIRQWPVMCEIPEPLWQNVH